MLIWSVLPILNPFQIELFGFKVSSSNPNKMLMATPSNLAFTIAHEIVVDMQLSTFEKQN